MTNEGIIPTAFKKYINWSLGGEHGLLPKNSFEFQQLQQEIVAEIKKRRDAEVFDEGVFSKAITLELLLGTESEALEK